MQTQLYARKPFYVQVPQEVTLENIEQIAKWCGGEVRTNKKVIDDHGNTMEEKFIKVPVSNPLNDRQTMAFVGDRVLRAEANGTFKVYNPRAFEKAFELVNGTQKDEHTQRQKEHAEGPTH